MYVATHKCAAIGIWYIKTYWVTNFFDTNHTDALISGYNFIL